MAVQVKIDTVVTVTNSAQLLSTILSQNYEFYNGVELLNFESGTQVVHGLNDTVGFGATDTGSVLFHTNSYVDRDQAPKMYNRASEIYLLSDQASSNLRVRFVGRAV